MDLEMREFELPQYYETTIAMRTLDGDIESEFLFLSLPASAIHEDNKALLADPPALLTMLGLDESSPLRVAQLPDAIFTLLTADDPGPAVGFSQGPVPQQGWLDEQRVLRPEAALVAEYLAFAEVVPFEQSRAQAAALATKAMKSYALGGWLIGSSPAAAMFGPHVAVAYAAGASGTFIAVSVVNSIGVAIGFVLSEKTAAAAGRVRRGFRRLIHGRDHVSPPADRTSAVTDEQQLRAAEDELLAAEKLRLEAEREHRESERKLREAHRRTLERQADLNRRYGGRRLIIESKPSEGPAD